MLNIKIKNAISFDEYNAIINKVVNDCFPDGTYSPANYDLSLRTSLLLAFAPDYNLSDCKDNNELWEQVTNDEANEILDYIATELSGINQSIKRAIWDNIDYRIKLLTSGGMSMSDIALSNLLDILAKKTDEIDVNMLNNEDLDIVKQASSSIHDGTAVEKIANVIIDNVASEKSDDKSEITVTSKESDV